MAELPRSETVLAPGGWQGATDHVALDYEGRFLRRKRLIGASGQAFLVDLPEARNLAGGEAFQLADGRLVEVRCALEPVLAVTGDITRYAWHIGNRHTPCQIELARLLIRADHVLEAMLRQMGAGVTAMLAPFRPESGAYGMGRTFGHAHEHTPGHGHTAGAGHFHVHG